jgi:hypothetical protein
MGTLRQYRRAYTKPLLKKYRASTRMTKEQQAVRRRALTNRLQSRLAETSLRVFRDRRSALAVLDRRIGRHR